MRSKPVVAIDGPSGVGKSTVAKKLAKKLGFAFVDTGALYRAVALTAKTDGIDWQDEKGLSMLANSHSFTFDSTGSLSVDGTPVGDSIRTPEMSLGASEVARLTEVRKALLTVQREIGSDGGVVLEGRDIGTTVFPDAEIKIFLTASPVTRAARRFKELKGKGEKIELEQVRREQESRDESDRNRSVSPLRKAPDAFELECDDMSADQVTEFILDYIKSNFPLTSK